MSEKFSVGPWKVVDTVEPLYVLDGKGYDVCRMATIEPREENEANARLTAAAPDLYAACVLALPLLREVAMRSGLSYPDAAGIGMEVADALRKARGDDEQ